MKLQQEKRQISNSGFKTSGFGAELNSVAFHTISSSIYTYKARAVVREVSCNAVDACKDFDLPVRFDVTMPNEWNGNYIVRDYGIGLTDEEVRGYNVCESCGTKYNLNCDHQKGYNKEFYDDIEDEMVEKFIPLCDCGHELKFVGGIYNTYFKSTKRDSEKTTGCLGLGTKSPFSIADAFTVESFKDGIHRSYSCHYNEKGEPEIAQLFEQETDEENGVRVSVATGSYYRDFHQEAVKVYQHFDVLPNFTNDENGELVAEIEAEREKYAIERDGYRFTGKTGTCYAVMCNVAYAIPSEYIYLEGTIDFDSGSLSFTPGREQLELNKRTKRILKSKIESIKTDLAYDMFREIRAIDGVFNRAKKLEEFKNGMFGELSKEDRLRLRFFEIQNFRKYKIKSYRKEYGQGFAQLTENILPIGRTVFYFRVGDDQSIRGYKNRLRAYCGSQHTAVVLTNEMIDYFDIPNDKIKELEDLPVVASSSGGGGPRSKEKVFVYNGGTQSGNMAKYNWDAVDIDLDDGEERVYVVIDRYQPKCCGTYGLREFQNKMEAYTGHDIKIYGVKTALTRQKRWEDNQGSFVTLEEYKKKTVKLPKVWISKPNDNDTFRYIEPLFDHVEHDLFDKVVKLKDQREKQIDAWYIWDWDQITKDDSLDNAINELIDTFPLFKMCSWSSDVKDNLDGFIEYVNLKKNSEK